MPTHTVTTDSSGNVTSVERTSTGVNAAITKAIFG